MDLAVAIDAAFPCEFVEPAGNVVRSGPAGQMDRRGRRYRAPVARRRGARSRIEHRSLIAAISSRDERRAMEITRAHTERTRRMYREREEGRQPARTGRTGRSGLRAVCPRPGRAVPAASANVSESTSAPVCARGSLSSLWRKL
ncbi:FCD domain-containing protein [Streptomyces sp. NPDC101194]|uniref:FCD domain-containing protein n=1 Tax=Streptomyces sp. NPDC101194 TaxID=3366127 RepID=UPI00380A84E9